MQIVQIDGRDYVLVLTPLPRPGAVNFKVGVVEENNKKKIKNILLDTEIVLPDGEVAMLGFRDSQEKQLFHRFLRAGARRGIRQGCHAHPGFAEPKMLKNVKPVYPEEALEEKIQGVVILEAVNDNRAR